MRKLLALIILLVVAMNANAIIGPLRFAPFAPTTNDTLTFMVETFGCHAFVGGANGFNREVEVVGNKIKVTAPGISNSDFLLCFFPHLDSTFNIGNVPAGAYIVELNLRHNLNPTVIELVQTGNVLITQGAANLVPVPSIEISGLLLIFTLILIIGSFAAKNSR